MYENIFDMVKRSLVLILPGISIQPRRAIYSAHTTVPINKNVSVKQLPVKKSP
jgi:hypothetical protein